MNRVISMGTLLDGEVVESNTTAKKQALSDLNSKSFKNTLEEVMIKEKRLGRAARDEAAINKANLKDRVDGAVSRLASFFKIGVNLMLSILQSLGIKPEDLVDEGKMEIVIKKLAKYFGLSEKQKDKLIELLKGC